MTKLPQVLLVTLALLPFHRPAFAGAGDPAADKQAFIANRTAIDQAINSVNSNLKNIEQKGSGCTDYMDHPICPGVAGVNGNKADFINPTRTNMNQVKAFLEGKLKETEATLAEGISANALDKVTVCQSGPEVSLNSLSQKKKSLADSIAAINLLLNGADPKKNDGLKEKFNELHRGGEPYLSTAKKCGNIVSDREAGFASGFVKFVGTVDRNIPPTPHAGLALAFSKDNKHPSCDSSVLKSYLTIADKEKGQVKAVVTQLEALSKKMNDASEKIDKVMVATAAVGRSCPTSIAQETPPIPTGPAKDEKPSGVSKADEKKSDVQPTPIAAAAAPEAKKADAPISTTTADKENSAGGVAKQILTDPEVVPQPPESHPVAKSLDRDPFAFEESVAKPDSKPAEVAYKEGTGDITPKITSEDNTALNSKDLRNYYQQNEELKKRDLDLYSKKDTAIIQRALNSMQSERSPASRLATDGLFGNQTAARLSNVMSDPVQKAAFLKALRVQMSK
ncbi:MAG: hypothetical protein AB7K68_14415 [Bacteriovoracia bacterium]